MVPDPTRLDEFCHAYMLVHSLTIREKTEHQGMTREEAQHVLDERIGILQDAVSFMGVAQVIRRMNMLIRDADLALDLSDMSLVLQDFKDVNLNRVNLRDCSLIGANFLRTTGIPRMEATARSYEDITPIDQARLDYILSQQMATRQLQTSIRLYQHS